VHPELTDEVKAAILSGDVVIGMTMEEVIASRGCPWDVNRTTTAYRTNEQWVMGPVDSMATWPRRASSISTSILRTARSQLGRVSE